MEEMTVKTPLGTLVVKASSDPNYPGVYIDLRREGCECDAPLAMVECTPDEADAENPAIITRVWDDVREEDYQTRVVHTGVEEYFQEDE